jgi:UDP-2,3-diacylglucosamine pyrophosphatase LpxH
MKFNFLDIITLGDIHSDFYVITNHMNRFSIEDTLYIQVGDFGIGFNKTDFDDMIELNEQLSNQNNFLYVVRGNHDDPEWFIDGKYTEFKETLSNIVFVKDYSTYEFNDETYLFIGGAISVDRKDRIKVGKKWFENEIIDFDYDFCANVTGIDRIIAHTSPSFCPPYWANVGNIMDRVEDDPTLMEELSNERNQMTKIIEDIMKNNDLKSFHHGHFHRSSKTLHEGCDFICLDINEFSII